MPAGVRTAGREARIAYVDGRHAAVHFGRGSEIPRPRSCAASTGDGAPVSGSPPDWVLVKRVRRRTEAEGVEKETEALLGVFRPAAEQREVLLLEDRISDTQPPAGGRPRAVSPLRAAPALAASSSSAVRPRLSTSRATSSQNDWDAHPRSGEGRGCREDHRTSRGAGRRAPASRSRCRPTTPAHRCGPAGRSRGTGGLIVSEGGLEPPPTCVD